MHNNIGILQQKWINIKMIILPRYMHIVLQTWINNKDKKIECNEQVKTIKFNDILFQILMIGKIQ